MKFKLKGGVLIIGSLYWQSWRDRPNDKIRNNWWDASLNKEASIDVKVPIRYGRFSKEGAYTMIFHKDLETNKLGSAKVVPFIKREFTRFDQILQEARELSKAEGKGTNLIKGIQEGKDAWGACTILINPEVDFKVAQKLRESWLAAVRATPDPHNKIDKLFDEKSLYTISDFGELDIPWPQEANNFDFLLSTSTKPRLREGICSISTEEIAKYVGNRDYFHSNRANDIVTFEDEAINSFIDA